MATLTYDPSETQEGELNQEEQEALEVGEKLAEQQEQLLAGKFKDAEELEKGYMELQKKLGEPSEETAEPEEKVEAKEEDKEKEAEINTELLDTLWEESQKEFTKETLDKLDKLDNRELVSMYLKQRAEVSDQLETPALTEEQVTQLKDVAGGDSQYTEMMQWASSNLGEKEIQMYDAVMDKGDPLASFFAVQALAYRFNDSRGTEGRMLTGKAATTEGSQFRSQAEVVKAMSDPRYEKDPAYRQDIYDKLERSNINF